MEDLLAASQLGAAWWSQGMLFRFRGTSRKAQITLTVFSELQPPTRIVQPDKQFGLHQVAGKTKDALLSLLTDGSVVCGK
jgi:hypothetical protein